MVDDIKDAINDEGHELIENFEATDRGYDGLLIPSGSVMLNLACSDRWDGAWKPGRIVNVIGDSSSGKTLLAISMFGEMGLREDFDNYRFIYDDAEHALDFDLEGMLGTETASRIEPPDRDAEGAPLYSNTIQDFQRNVMKAITEGKPFIYVLDSFDALTSIEEIEHTDAEMKASEQGKKASGTYGTEKAKYASKILRVINSHIEKTKSFILIISQTRDDINPMTFTQKTRSGGRALKFYSSHEIWLAVGSKIKKTVSGVDYQIGVNVRAKVSKNKLTGKLREVEFPVYYDYGVDDVQAVLTWLDKVKAIEKSKQTYKIPELRLEGTLQNVIKQVDEQEKWDDLFTLAQVKWKEIEDKLSTNRKPKFQRRRH